MSSLNTNDQGRPVLSVIIPTRNRCETLTHSIQTVLNERGSDFELIVSDNQCEDETRSVIESFPDSRLRYIRTDSILSMCDHWEFAIAHVRGDYVLIIGDDDGIMPGGFEKLIPLLKSGQHAIYFWRLHYYVWPIGEQGGYLRRVSPAGQTRIEDIGKRADFSLAHGTWRYSTLPSAYHCAVSRSLFDRIRKESGRIFHSTQPDIFTCYALAAQTPTALLTERAVSISGHSSKSSSGFTVAGDPRPAERTYREYGDYKVHSTLYPDVPWYFNLIPDAALVARDLYPDRYGKVRFGYEAMWAFLIRLWKPFGYGKVLELRKYLGGYHPFSTSRYRFCCLVQTAAEIRARLRNPANQLEQAFKAGRYKRPANIKECGELLGTLNL